MMTFKIINIYRPAVLNYKQLIKNYLNILSLILSLRYVIIADQYNLRYLSATTTIVQYSV